MGWRPRSLENPDDAKISSVLFGMASISDMKGHGFCFSFMGIAVSAAQGLLHAEPQRVVSERNRVKSGT
jgi:hypothetical protein